MIQNIHNKLNNTLKNKIQHHKFTSWINNKGWKYYEYQLNVVDKFFKKKDILVTAPTGAGKTIAGFLPSIIDISEKKIKNRLHTIYISPLKSLAYDIERNLRIPFEKLKLDISLDIRTGDTSTYKKRLILKKPPNILITTPESFALIMSYKDAEKYFSDIKCIIIDELHNLMHTKRGDLLSLNITRLRTFSTSNVIALSATIKDKKDALNYISNRKNKLLIQYKKKTFYNLNILKTKSRIPWSGHLASYAVADIYKKISNSYTTIIFVNTRAQSEYLFKSLWDINISGLKIAVHHGSLEKNIRKRIEKKIFLKEIDCVIATGTLELGIDWGNIGLVIQVGAPKGIARMLQRIGRSNHRLEETSNAILVPTNKFEYLECLALKQAIKENGLEVIDKKDGSLDVLAQHILGVACSTGFSENALYKTIKSSYPYKNLEKNTLKRIIQFIENGGYSLKNYKQFNKIIKDSKGNYNVENDKVIKQYRMNIGTIVENQLLPIYCKNKKLGLIEEFFIQNLETGDTFLFAGETLKFLSINSKGVQTIKSKSKEAKIPSYVGGRLPLSTELSNKVLEILYNFNDYKVPKQILEWVNLQKTNSLVPKKNSILVETFLQSKIYHMVIYTFEGKKANQTLGILILKKLEELRNKPLSFVSTDYAIAIKTLNKVENIFNLLSKNNLLSNFNNWINSTNLTKRHFRNIAIISGLIEKKHPGHIKTNKQVNFNSDLIFDVLLKFEKKHILLEATKMEVLEELIDYKRLERFFSKVKNDLIVKELNKLSPFSASLLLEFDTVGLNSDKIIAYSLGENEKNILKDVTLI